MSIGNDSSISNAEFSFAKTTETPLHRVRAFELIVKDKANIRYCDDGEREESQPQNLFKIFDRMIYLLTSARNPQKIFAILISNAMCEFFKIPIYMFSLALKAS